MWGEGFSLNGVVLSCCDPVDATPFSLISSDSLVVAVCDPPAPAAGHICRHDGFRLQGPPPPNATVTLHPLLWHFPQSDLAALWCATMD